MKGGAPPRPPPCGAQSSRSPSSPVSLGSSTPKHASPAAAAAAVIHEHYAEHGPDTLQTARQRKASFTLWAMDSIKEAKQADADADASAAAQESQEFVEATQAAAREANTIAEFWEYLRDEAKANCDELQEQADRAAGTAGTVDKQAGGQAGRETGRQIRQTDKLWPGRSRSEPQPDAEYLW